MDKFIKAVDGEADPDFWNAAAKIASTGDSDSAPGLNGWIGNFFPYLDEQENTELRDLD